MYETRLWPPPFRYNIHIISTIRLLELPRALRHTATNQKLGEDAFNIIIAISLIPRFFHSSQIQLIVKRKW